MSSVDVNQPYSPNYEGFVGSLQDLRSTMPNQIVFKVVGYRAECFENVNQGEALFCRDSDGKIRKSYC